jgi:levoglucosan dehydrogenase
MTQALRIGIVGAGYIAGVHSAAYRAVGGTFPGRTRPVELAGIADRVPDRAESLARAWGWSAVRGDWRELTRSDEIDVIDVCVPNALHAEIAIDALEHGKHVVCEKPLAADARAAAGMVAAANASPCLAQVCFFYRVWPAIAWAKRIIAEGRIGPLVHFRGWMLQDYASESSAELGWRVDRAQAGAGALGDLGSHIFDVARYLAGDILRVNALTRTTVDRGARADRPDDLAAMLVEFWDGTSGVLEASWALKGHKADLGFDVVGRDGAIRFSWERANEIDVFTRDSHTGGFERVLIGPEQPSVGNIVAVAGQGLGYRDSFTIGLGRFIEAITRGDRFVAPSFEDGLRACDFVAAAQASAQARTWVELADGASRVAAGRS